MEEPQNQNQVTLDSSPSEDVAVTPGADIDDSLMQNLWPENEQPAEEPDADIDDGAPAAQDREDDDGEAEPDDAETDEDEADEAEDGEQDEDGEIDLSSIPKNLQPVVGKLIKATRDKERAKAEQIRQSLDEVTRAQADAEQAKATAIAQVAELKAAKLIPAATEDNPFPDVMTPQDIETKQRELWALKSQLRKNPYEVKVNGEPVTEDQAADMIDLIEQRLQFDLPKRKEFLASHDRMEQALRKAAPDAFQPESELAIGINRVISQLPALKTIPGYRNSATAFLAGSRLLNTDPQLALKLAREAHKPATKTAGRAAVPPRTPPSPPRSTAAKRKPARASRDIDDELMETLGW